jgi:hypothetical protein
LLRREHPLWALLALVIGRSAVAQFNDEFNVKFRANRLRSWLALADHIQPLVNGSFVGVQFPRIFCH